MTAVELLLVGVILFSYFAPAIYIAPSPHNCVFSPSLTSMCPNESPYYASLTYVLVRSGGIYLAGTYSVKL